MRERDLWLHVNRERSADEEAEGSEESQLPGIYVKVTPASLYTLKTFSMALT